MLSKILEAIAAGFLAAHCGNKEMILDLVLGVFGRLLVVLVHTN